MNPKLELAHFVEWLANGERGLSSEAIVSQLTQRQVGRNFGRGEGRLAKDHPYDPGDFWRCEKLLRQYPSARPAFLEVMPGVSPTWAALIERWDDLVSMIESERAERLLEGITGGGVPRAYNLMCELRGVPA